MVKTKIVLKTGKRKTAIARATLLKGKGNFIINNESVDSYIKNELLNFKVKEPLVLTDSLKIYDIKVNVRGGGQSSQVDAIRQAIARCIVEYTGNEDIKKRLTDYDRSLLVSDTRFKEMYKPNNSKARAKRQKSFR